MPSLHPKSSQLSRHWRLKAMMISDLKSSEALNRKVLWLTRVCKVTWCSARTPKGWQTAVIIPTHKKWDRRECTNYRGIALYLATPEKSRSSAWKRYRKKVEQNMEDMQSESTRASLLEAAWSTVCFLRTISYCWQLHPWIGSCFVGASEDEIIARKDWWVISLRKRKAVHAASWWQCTAAGGEGQVTWVGIHKWWRQIKEFIAQIW